MQKLPKISFYILSVALFSVLCTYFAFAAEKVELKVGYLPKTKYRLKSTALNNMTMKLQNPFSVTEEVRSKFPLAINSKDESIIDVKTGSLIDNNTFPITFEVVKFERTGEMNGSKLPVEKSKLIGVRAYGTSDFNGNMKFSKIEGKDLSQDEKAVFSKVFEQMGKSLTQIQTKPVAVGESFTQKIPLKIPIPGIANINFEMEQIFKLKNLRQNIAEFDGIYHFKLLQSPEVDSVVNIQISGEGSGKIIYDKEKRTKTNTTSKYKIKGKIPLEGSEIEISSSSSLNATTELQQ